MWQDLMENVTESQESVELNAGPQPPIAINVEKRQRSQLSSPAVRRTINSYT